MIGGKIVVYTSGMFGSDAVRKSCVIRVHRECSFIDF